MYFVGISICVFEEHVRLRDVCACMGQIWGLLEGCGQARVCVSGKVYAVGVSEMRQRHGDTGLGLYGRKAD